MLFRSAKKWLSDRFHDFSVMNASTIAEEQMASLAAIGIQESGKALNYLKNHYPAKTFGAIALSGSLALSIDGFSPQQNNDTPKNQTTSHINQPASENYTMDIPLILGGGIFAATNISLIAFGDRKRKKNSIDPQDEENGLIKIFNFRKYPHEFSSTWGTLGGLGLLGWAGLNHEGGDQTGHIAMALIQLPAWAVTTFVNQKDKAVDSFNNKALDLPIIKQSANFVMTHPLMIAAPLYQGGVMALGSYELAQSDWSITEVDPEIILNTVMYSAANGFYFFASKRQKEETKNNINDADAESIDLDPQIP